LRQHGQILTGDLRGDTGRRRRGIQYGADENLQRESCNTDGPCRGPQCSRRQLLLMPVMQIWKLISCALQHRPKQRRHRRGAETTGRAAADACSYAAHDHQPTEYSSRILDVAKQRKNRREAVESREATARDWRTYPRQRGGDGRDALLGTTLQFQC
jgi:hypothetical protein